jgi:hypothetical protein
MNFESPMLDGSKEQTEGRYIAAAQVGAWLSMGILNIVVTWLALTCCPESTPSNSRA